MLTDISKINKSAIFLHLKVIFDFDIFIGFVKSEVDGICPSTEKINYLEFMCNNIGLWCFRKFLICIRRRK